METPENGWYHVDKDGKQQGPIDRAALIALHSSGEIGHATLIWAAGCDGWKGFRSVFDDLVPPPIPSAGPPPVPTTVLDPNASSAPPPVLSPAKSPSGLFPSAHTRYYKRPEEAEGDTSSPLKPSAPAAFKEIGFAKEAPDSKTEESGQFARIYAVFAHVLSLIFAGTLIVLFEGARAPSLRGLVGFLAEGAGYIIPAIAIGGLGLLFKPARFPAFVLLSWIAVYLIAQGAFPK